MEIRIDNFEGPLDLLLHLIKKNEVDIYDIPIAVITSQYLATLDAMKSLNLDVAGEFLVMAATLLHIKSRMLLPAAPEEDLEEEEEDPRAELVRRLLEYQRFKEAAVALDDFPLLERDVFARKFPPPGLPPEEETEFQSVGLFELVEAFRQLLRETPQEIVHQVEVERLSVADRIHLIVTRLNGRDGLSFRELFSERPERPEVVVTFLAMLELVKLRLVRLLQGAPGGPIWLFPAVAAEEFNSLQLEDDALGYQ